MALRARCQMSEVRCRKEPKKPSRQCRHPTSDLCLPGVALAKPGLPVLEPRTWIMRKYLITSVALVLLAAVGCTPNPKQENLANYVNRDMLGIARVEQAALGSYSAATGKNFKSMAHLYETLDQEVIPAYERFCILLRQIRPEDEEVLHAHTQYVRGAEKALKGFKLKKYGVHTRDVNLILMANDTIDEGLKQTFQWKSKIAALQKDRGLKSEDEIDSALVRWLMNLQDELIIMGGKR